MGNPGLQFLEFNCSCCQYCTVKMFSACPGIRIEALSTTETESTSSSVSILPNLNVICGHIDDTKLHGKIPSELDYIYRRPYIFDNNIE